MFVFVYFFFLLLFVPPVMGFRTYAVFVFCSQLVESMNRWWTVRDLFLSCIHHVCLKDTVSFVQWGDQLNWGWTMLLGSGSFSLWALHALLFSVCLSAARGLQGFISASVLRQAMSTDSMCSFHSIQGYLVQFCGAFMPGAQRKILACSALLGFLALEVKPPTGKNRVQCLLFGC